MTGLKLHTTIQALCQVSVIFLTYLSSILCEVLVHDFTAKCPSGHPVFLPGFQTCVKASKLNHPCHYDEQCQHYDKNTMCKGLCACTKNYTKIDIPHDLLICKPKVNLDDQCEYSEQCETVNAHSWCNEKICKCYFHRNEQNSCNYGENSKSGTIPKWLLVAIGAGFSAMFLILAYDSIKKYLCRTRCRGKSTTQVTNEDNSETEQSTATLRRSLVPQEPADQQPPVELEKIFVGLPKKSTDLQNEKIEEKELKIEDFV